MRRKSGSPRLATHVSNVNALRMSCWADGSEIARSTAHYFDQFLNGTNPDSLPVEEPAEFELVIRLTTGGVVANNASHPVLMRAHRVIE